MSLSFEVQHKACEWFVYLKLFKQAEKLCTVARYQEQKTSKYSNQLNETNNIFTFILKQNNLGKSMYYPSFWPYTKYLAT